MFYKIIFIIISSNDNSIYANFRDLFNVYMKNYKPIIKYFFIEFCKDQNELIIEKNNYLYIKGEESINPGMILKTCKAFEYINNTYNYEFVIRTNLSTFFHIPNLLEYIFSIPNENACGGFSYRGFITGTGIILTRDVANKIVNEFINYNIIEYNEDIIISSILNKLKIPYFNPNKYYMWGLIIDEKSEPYPEYHYMIPAGKFIDIDFPDNILYFRIKNSLDRNLDILYYKLLLNKIYNIIV